MKKLIIFAICAMTAVSAFAEAFSLTKLNKIKDWKEKAKYSYESEVSKQSSGEQHMQLYYWYLYLENKNMTAQQILKESYKFKDVKNYELGLGLGYALFIHTDKALEQYEKTKNIVLMDYLAKRLIVKKKYDEALTIAEKYGLNNLAFYIYRMKKDYSKCWEYGAKTLTKIGGYNKPDKCTEIINFMFRYKPASVTKEQQIEFLTKIADIYPIPGTDFNKWKTFMGFVGFKYKALTGKDLF